MSYYATNRLTAILEHIQELHAEARQLSLDYNIPFELTLLRADGYTQDHNFNPSDARSVGWASSRC